MPGTARNVVRAGQRIAFQRGFTHQQFSGHAHRLQRRAQVVAEYRQEDIPRAVHLFGIGGRGFGECFIDGFVEADHVLEIGQVR
ncbi:hypothetical protein D3C73_661820 [compost metagenome]